MGYIASSTTKTVIARLTSYGRKKLLSNSNDTFVSYFSLGDSDANYQTSKILGEGKVPGSSGNLNSISGMSNSVYNNITIKNKLIYNSTGDLYKPVGIGSSDVIERQSYLSTITLSGDSLQFDVINRTDYTSDPLVNLFSTFGLPLTVNDLNKYTNLSNNSGGYSDTALSGLSNDEILVISIPNTQYGELIDGKTIKLDITSGGVPYTCYGTYQRSNLSKGEHDANIRETSSNITPVIGDNIVLLFSDTVKKPNGDTSKSWSTGFGNAKPYSLGGKELFNYISNTSQGYNVDIPIGIAYIDKGFIVITNDDIVSEFTVSTESSATTVTYNSVTTDISKSIVCDALISEFRESTNPTFTSGVNIPRVTEIGLYDNKYQLVAIAKLSEPHVLNNMYFRVEVKITV